MLGLDLYFMLEPKYAKSIMRGDGTTFSVPFKAFEDLIGETTHMQDGPLHTYWVSPDLPPYLFFYFILFYFCFLIYFFLLK
jgi:hypothetical protein